MAVRRELSPPSDLTVPEPNSTTARDVLSRAVERALLELRSVMRAYAPTSPDVAGFQRVLAASLPAGVGPLASVLRRPHVGTLVRALRAPAPGTAAALVNELVALLSFELALLDELPVEIRLRSSPRRWLSMVGRLAVQWPADTIELVLASGRVTIVQPNGTRTVELAHLRQAEAGQGTLPNGVTIRRPFHEIDGGVLLAVEDNNPLFLEEAHPDKSGNAVDLGGVPLTAWLDTLRAAFAHIERYMPELRAEMAVYVSQIVPVGAFADKHLSASYQEAIGTIYMSHHPNVMTMTEALVHEFQHNKINALFELDAVLENAFSPLFRSPVRPDPRPLHGVLLAVHAFVPVARLYERMLEAEALETKHSSFRARFADIVAINREGSEVLLANAKPTRVGAGVLDELHRWDRHYRCAG